MTSGDLRSKARRCAKPDINTQPMMLTAGVAVYRAWKKRAVRGRRCLPGTVWGYSAGSPQGQLRSETLFRWSGCARKRCKMPCRWVRVQWRRYLAWMTMSFLRSVQKLPRRNRRGGQLQCPSQVVIAGHKSAVERAAAAAKAKGAKRAMMLR